MNYKRQHFIIALTANLSFFIAALPPVMAQGSKGETVNNSVGEDNPTTQSTGEWVLDKSLESSYKGRVEEELKKETGGDTSGFTIYPYRHKSGLYDDIQVQKGEIRYVFRFRKGDQKPEILKFDNDGKSWKTLSGEKNANEITPKDPKENSLNNKDPKKDPPSNKDPKEDSLNNKDPKKDPPNNKDPKEDLSNNRDPKKVPPNTINSGGSPSINGNMKENTLRNGEHEKGKSTESNPSKTVLEGREGSRDKRDLQNHNPTTSNSQSVHVVPYADSSYHNHAGWKEDINKYMNAAKEYYRRVGVELEIDTPQVLDQDIGNMDVDANNKVKNAPHSSPSPAYIKIGFTDREKIRTLGTSNYWVKKHPDIPLPSVTSLHADHPSEKNGDMDLRSIWTVLHEMGHDFGLDHKEGGKNLMESTIVDEEKNPDLNNNENLQLSEDQKQQVRSAVQIWLHKKINWSNGSPEEKKASNLKSNPGVHPDKIQ
ncbi:hypothetical protein [Pasteuria penetrans]|uniref:hypothetical protein n=1 Tax=Pasteuria penetrans TaxID=86005 RepID=UPI000F9548A2|nr:hypothetical protein [Pasteuria penetrans]